MSSKSKRKVFVIGASGTIGFATVKVLSQKYADQLEIYAGVRSPEKAEKLKSLANVKIVKAEMGADQVGLQEVFTGIDFLYIVTPGSRNRVDLTKRTADAAKKAGVKSLMVISVILTDLAFTEDTFLFAEMFHEIEKHVKELGLPWTFLRLPGFYENMMGFARAIKNNSSISLPFDENATFAAMAAADMGLAGATIMAHPEKHRHQTYKLFGDRSSPNSICKAFSKVLGRDIKHVKLPYEDHKEMLRGFGIPDWQVEGLMHNYKLCDKGSPHITLEGCADDFGAITGQKAMSTEDWIRQFSFVFK